MQEILVAALRRELAFRSEQFGVSSWDTLYIGGGTPSLLHSEQLRVLSSDLAGHCREATIEANPQDLSEQWLKTCADCGFSRLSLGIQSMNDKNLSAAGRRGTRAGNIAGLECAARFWQGDLSIDLISGLPGQSEDELLQDIAEVMEYHCDHISLYALTVEDGTPLAKRLSTSESFDEDASDSLWIAGRDALEEAGYQQYEVSNFARQGKESLHNRSYWEMQSWVGLGPGASGTIISGDRAKRFTNRTDIQAYLADPIGSGTVEVLDRQTLILETVMMGFRMREGISRIAFQNRFSADIMEFIGLTVNRWQSRGLLTKNTEQLALNRDGLLFLNRFIEECLEELCEKKTMLD